MSVNAVLNGTYADVLCKDKKMSYKLVNELKEFLQKGHKLNKEEAKNVAGWMFKIPSVIRVMFWSFLNQNIENLFAVHPHVSELMVTTAKQSYQGQDKELEEFMRCEREAQKEKFLQKYGYIG